MYFVDAQEIFPSRIQQEIAPFCLGIDYILFGIPPLGISCRAIHLLLGYFCADKV